MLKNRRKFAEYTLIAEKALGRALPLGAVIHHVNGIKTDDSRGNHVICENHAYHSHLHQRIRAYRATGSPTAVKCHYCKQWGELTSEWTCKGIRGNVMSKHYRHKLCHAERMRMRWRMRRQ